MAELPDTLVVAPPAAVDSPESLAPPSEEPDSVNAVLAAQARGRGASELWTTALGGSMNALLLWTQFPKLHWLASAFVAVAAYGAWGLLDRTLSELALNEHEPDGSRTFVRL